MKTDALYLTAAQMRAAVQELEGVRLPQRTLAGWLQEGLVKASIQYDGIRGAGHPVIFNLDDLVRVRFVVRLRRVGRWSPAAVREVLADPLMRRALRAKSDDLEIVITAGRVLVQSKKDAAAAAVDVPRGQFTFRFPATELIEGNEQVARRIVEETAAA